MMHSLNNTTRRLEPLVNKTLLRLRPQNVHIFLPLLLVCLWATVGQASSYYTPRDECIHGKDMISEGCYECEAETAPRSPTPSDTSALKVGDDVEVRSMENYEDGVWDKVCTVKLVEISPRTNECVVSAQMLVNGVFVGKAEEWILPDYLVRAVPSYGRGNDMTMAEATAAYGEPEETTRNYNFRRRRLNATKSRRRRLCPHAYMWGDCADCVAQKQETTSAPRARRIRYAGPPCVNDPEICRNRGCTHCNARRFSCAWCKRGNGQGAHADNCSELEAEYTRKYNERHGFTGRRRLAEDNAAPSHGLPAADQLHRRQLAALKARASTN